MDWLWRQARRRPDAIALWSGGDRLNYAELSAQAASGAARLDQQGFRAGDTLLWEARATVPALCWLHAALWAGAAVVPFRPGSEAAAVRGLALRAGAVGLLATRPSLADRSDGPAILIDAMPIPARPTARKPGEGPPVDGIEIRSPAVPDPARIVTLIQTSGSTGATRLVPLRARQHEASVRAIADRLQLGPEDRWLVCLPLHHVGGLAIVLRAAYTGAGFALQARFDAPAVRRAIERDAITHLSLVPTQLKRLVETIDRPLVSSLRGLLVGGARAEPRLLERARSLGLPVIPTWGMTEAASQLATPSPSEAAAIDFSRSAGLAGRPLPGVELRPADGSEAELRVRAPMLFEAYFDSAGGPDTDGWYATGDRGFVDPEGRVWVVGRIDDRIISGGENVDALAVEEALLASGLVDAVSVIGLPDEEWGQRVAAVVVSESDRETLAKWVREHLEPHQRPRFWRFVDRLPCTDSGKPDRAALVRMLQEP